jgi:hypothetical protein
MEALRDRNNAGAHRMLQEAGGRYVESETKMNKIKRIVTSKTPMFTE